MRARRRLHAGDTLSLIVNPATRRNAQAVVSAIEAAASPGVRVDVRVTDTAGDAVRLARDAAREASMVVAVGGDGTVADVACGLFGTEVSLGIIPAGSTNITAAELGIPRNWRNAIRIIFDDFQDVPVDLGRCGDRAFLHMAGAGMDSRLFLRSSARLKRRAGWLAYLPAASRGLFDRPANFTLEIDGQRMEVVSPMVIVANSGSIITPSIRLHPLPRTDDGWLDVLIFTATGPMGVLRTLARLATQSLDRSSHLRHVRAKNVEMVSDPALPVQLDGDVVAVTPVSFSISPGGVRVVVPFVAERHS